ncbi:MAG: hypothetical protein GY737_07395 [Desulfobacteraceae bacterium]|nr:hypothetical protein [Desulfobacteraceae bacterium]
MNTTDTLERPLWEQRAMAFVTRSFRQLWGKNNEDMLAWLYNMELSNPFARARLLGWNKHGQTRNPELWGVEPTDDNPALLLPRGLVVPYIVDKRLRKITIVNKEETVEVRGGSREPMVLGNDSRVMAIVPDCMDGHFLFQEKGERLSVIIPCSQGEPLDATTRERLSNAGTVLVFHKDSHPEILPGGPAMDIGYSRSRELPGLCDPFIKD